MNERMNAFAGLHVHGSAPTQLLRQVQDCHTVSPPIWSCDCSRPYTIRSKGVLNACYDLECSAMMQHVVHTDSIKALGHQFMHLAA